MNVHTKSTFFWKNTWWSSLVTGSQKLGPSPKFYCFLTAFLSCRQMWTRVEINTPWSTLQKPQHSEKGLFYVWHAHPPSFSSFSDTERENVLIGSWRIESSAALLYVYCFSPWCWMAVVIWAAGAGSVHRAASGCVDLMVCSILDAPGNVNSQMIHF